MLLKLIRICVGAITLTLTAIIVTALLVATHRAINDRRGKQ